MFGISTFAQSPFAALGGNAYPVDVAESFTLSDVYDGPAGFQGLLDESFSIVDGDGGGTSFDFFVSTVENYSLNDEAFGVADILVSQSDSFTLTTAEDIQVDFNPVYAETITYSDEYVGTQNAVGLDEEDATFTDEWNGPVDFKPTVSESYTITDSETGAWDALATVSEAYTLTDSYQAAVDFIGLLQEQFTVIDSLIARGWFKINDDQTVTWQAANNSQSVTWQNINDNQDPNWVVIDNTQG